jgi:RNA polymerase sigma-70 factor (ECF subfamily)
VAPSAARWSATTRTLALPPAADGATSARAYTSGEDAIRVHWRRVELARQMNIEGVSMPIEDQSEAAVAYRAHFGEVYRFLLRRSRNHHVAEELAQQVFAEAAVALSAAETQPHTLVGWLYRVAERRFVDEIRRRRRLELTSFDTAVAPIETFPGYGRAVAKALRAGIDQLPQGQRVVVIRHLLEERPYSDIAHELGITEQACKMRFSRAMKQLRTFLIEWGLES